MRKCAFRRVDSLDYSGNEALNTICSNLSFMGKDLKKIVITSCNPNDGKSYLALQIARNLARRGKRILLMDADLRKSHLISHYSITTDGELQGLAHYLAGYCSIDDILFETNIDNLYLVMTGRDVANPIPLLDSPAFADLLESLGKQFDMVLVDCPPIGLVIDAADIAGHCDGSILVVKYNNTRRKELNEAKWQLRQSGKPILGCILNDVTFDSISTKKYYNKSYYSHYTKYYSRKDKDKEAGK